MRQGGGVLLQLVAVDYRRDVYRGLVDRTEAGVTLVSGQRTFDASIRRADPEVPQKLVRNVFIWNDRLVWQAGVLRAAVNAPWVIAELNPRILSTWTLLLLRRFTRRPCVVWGHAFPRSGPSSRTDLLRRPLRRLAKVVLTYSEPEALALAARQQHLRVIAAPNALYRREDIGSSPVAADAVDGFVFVGRLVAAKKPELLLRAFSQLPPDSRGWPRLHIVGEGPLEAALRDDVTRLGIEASRVTFHGHVSSREALRQIHGRAVASVSSGYVGLALIQSLSFGVPQIVADAEPHSPEIAAAEFGRNAISFRANDAGDLATCLATTWHERARWWEARPAIAQACAETYSVDVMVDRMVSAICVAEARGAS